MIILYLNCNNFILSIYLEFLIYNVSVKRSNSSHCRAWKIKLIHFVEYLANANNDLRWHLSELML